MDKKTIILAALASADGVTYTPVQIQKMLFLIDKQIPTFVGGPHFHFEPYDYGPFDAEIYVCLEQLSQEKLIEIVREEGLRWNKYRLTPEGYQKGIVLLGELMDEAKKYIQDVNAFVRKLSFAELVASIYKAFPEMKVNSVFRG
ncbi:MAG: hypothetical protein ABSC89_10500 [Verrucomicrobiota bacterium]|jgi:uncharacterized protein YwgA